MGIRAFVDRPLRDRSAADDVAAAAAAHWGLSTPHLLRTGMNAIYVAGDAVLRISEPSAPAAASVELARALLEEGLRVSRPLHSDVVSAGSLSATCWERLIDIGEPIDWESIGSMVRRVHGLDRSVIPSTYPLPRPTDFPWWDFEVLLDEVGDVIDDGARAGIDDAIARWPNWASVTDAVVCHGDVHPGNVVMSAQGAVLIDWDLLCLAPAGWDHAPMMTWSQRWGGLDGAYDELARGYGRSFRGDPAAEAFAELRLVAATLMRLKAGLANDAAMPEAQRRLAHWRGEIDAPMWQAQ